MNRKLTISGAPAFTLIELMISIAMVLVLLVGVNQVFTYTTAAVGAGQALSAATRDGRAAQTSFANDLGGVASDGPFFIIHSAQVYAFRDRADLAASTNGDASKITVTSPGDTAVYPSTYNSRNHRVDTLEFFARGSFSGQTGNTGLVAPQVNSSEARIWIGFLKQPNASYLNPVLDSTYADADYLYPGLDPGFYTVASSTVSTTSKNPNNFFASDWELGRVATLLINSSTANMPSTLGSLYYPAEYTSGVAPTTLSPLSSYSSGDTASVATDSNTKTWHEEWSRGDVAQTSISTYTAQLSAWITANAGSNWWSRMFLGNAGAGGGDLFQFNPFLNATTTGLTAASLPARAARTAPGFLKGCTQFQVEFAGDFVIQDNNPLSATYGQVTDLVNANVGNGDGIDFKIDPVTGARSIRWYGLPTNPTGALTTYGGKQLLIPANTASLYSPGTKTFTPGTAFTGANVNYLDQTVPLRDVVASSATAVATANTLLSGAGAQWIERSIPAAPSSNDYGYGGMTDNSDYLVAWGPDSDAAGIPRPKMIRITFTIDTDSKQLPDGQTFQYVYTLPN